MPPSRRSQRRPSRRGREDDRPARRSGRRSSRETRQTKRSPRVSDEEESPPRKRRSTRRDSGRSRRESGRESRVSARSSRVSGRSRAVDDDDSDTGRYGSVRRNSGFMGLTQEQQVYAGVGAGAVLLLIVGAVIFAGGPDDDAAARRRRQRRAIDAAQMGTDAPTPQTPTRSRPYISTRKPFNGDAYGEGFGRGGNWIRIAGQRGNPTPDQVRLVAENMSSDYNMTNGQERKFVEGFVAAVSKSK